MKIKTVEHCFCWRNQIKQNNYIYPCWSEELHKEIYICFYLQALCLLDMT